MIKTINNKNIKALLSGSSILACGGGLAYGAQLANIQLPNVYKALSVGIKLISLENIYLKASYISVAEVGDSRSPMMEKILLKEGLKLLEQETGKKARGIIPDEIGQESITIESSIILGLPIIDTDFSGCRAVPTLKDVVLAKKLKDYTTSPFVLIKNSGEMLFVKKQASIEVDEKIVREQTASRGVVMVLGNLVTGKTVKDYLSGGSYSVCISLGLNLVNSDDFIKYLPGRLLFGPLEGTVTGIETKTVKGFDEKTIEINSKQDIKIDVKNEYMFLESGKYKFSYPDFIMIYDRKMHRGLHSSEIRKGQRITIIVSEGIR